LTGWIERNRPVRLFGHTTARGRFTWLLSVWFGGSDDRFTRRRSLSQDGSWGRSTGAACEFPFVSRLPVRGCDDRTGSLDTRFCVGNAVFWLFPLGSDCWRCVLGFRRACGICDACCRSLAPGSGKTVERGSELRGHVVETTSGSEATISNVFGLQRTTIGIYYRTRTTWLLSLCFVDCKQKSQQDSEQRTVYILRVVQVSHLLERVRVGSQQNSHHTLRSTSRARQHDRQIATVGSH